MKEKKTPEIIFNIIMSVIGIIFYNSVLLWKDHAHGIILDSWVEILWAVNLLLVTRVAGNFILLYYRPARLYFLVQTVFSLVSLLSVIIFFIVFPVDLSLIGGEWMNKGLRIILMIAMAGTIIEALVNLVKSMAGTKYENNGK